jgi:hypothetical protein
VRLTFEARRWCAPLLAVAGLLAAARAEAGWDPLKAAGASLGAGVREGISPVLADVDTRLGARVTQVGDVATKLVKQVDGVAGERIAQIDQSLEKRILQVQLSAQAVTKGALDQIDDISRKRLAEANVVGQGLVTQLGKETQKTLASADRILKERSADLGRMVDGVVEHADQVVQARIEQIDETAGRRLGNVDVIATKQRLALEQTLLRVAILVGLVVFVVFALRRMWEAYVKAADEVQGQRSLRAAWRVTAAMGKPLMRQTLAAGAAVGVLALLYQQLPLGAAREAEALCDRHKQGLAKSLEALDYTQVRFHASQLELLLPGEDSYYQAMAAKAELLRDLLARPGLLATTKGVGEVVERVQAVERLLGERADPDVLVAKAIVLWQVGQRRADEHEAASLCARALRLAPGGFALAPLARSYVLGFLHAPWIPAGTRLGRDRASIGELEDVLGRIAPDRAGSPLGTVVELDRLMRELDHDSTAA